VSGRGRIHRFLADDHDRLGALLVRALAPEGGVDGEAFWSFRTGLLKHIGMEERILFPATRQALGGQVLPWMRRLREDHGRIAALLVPTPTRARALELAAILDAHDQLEEGEAGAYADCEAALGPSGVDEILVRLENAPTPPPAPYFDGARRT
jgi:hypothetical protein